MSRAAHSVSLMPRGERRPDGRRELLRFVGLDPGGKNQFGWCVVEGTTRLPLAIIASGTAGDAGQAVAAALAAAGPKPVLAGVGIDSPLFWVPGERRVDTLVREAIKRAGAPNAGGTVQQVNSLRGACITQGILAAHLLRRVRPRVRVTEAHPKALLWLVAVASSTRSVVSVGMDHLAAFMSGDITSLCEHQRDAALGALAAWAMVSRAPGWRDLASEEQGCLMPVPRIEYWMPIEGGAPGATRV